MLLYKPFKILLLFLVAIQGPILGALSLRSLDMLTVYSNPIEDRIRGISTTYFSLTDDVEAMSLEDVAEELLEDEPFQVRGRVLNYPNPFTMDEGTTIGYYLSKQMDVTLKIYDMYGAEIFSEDYEAGSEGGLAPYEGYNRIPITKASFGGQELRTGVYIYMIINDGTVLSKGKMAVIQ